MNRRCMKRLTRTVVTLLASFTFALAEEAQMQPSGTVTKTDAVTGEFAVQDRDGKTYVLQKTDVVAQDLKTGDTVVYELVNDVPLHVRKQS